MAIYQYHMDNKDRLRLSRNDDTESYSVSGRTVGQGDDSQFTIVLI